VSHSHQMRGRVTRLVYGLWQVGLGKVIRGWDEGVATMKVGEVRAVSTLRCAQACGRVYIL